MPIFQLGEHQPSIDPSAWVAPTASVIGDVTIEAEASVWFGAVLRGDAQPIVIGAGSNVQDGSVLHGGHLPTVIGPGVTIGHSCVVHGATIGEGALIGNNATVLDGAEIGPRALIGAGAVVVPGTVVPADMVAVGAPAKVRGPLTEGQRDWVSRNAGEYHRLKHMYAEGCEEILPD